MGLLLLVLPWALVGSQPVNRTSVKENQVGGTLVEGQPTDGGLVGGQQTDGGLVGGQPTEGGLDYRRECGEEERASVTCPSYREGGKVMCCETMGVVGGRLSRSRRCCTLEEWLVQEVRVRGTVRWMEQGKEEQKVALVAHEQKQGQDDRQDQQEEVTDSLPPCSLQEGLQEIIQNQEELKDKEEVVLEREDELIENEKNIIENEKDVLEKEDDILDKEDNILEKEEDILEELEDQEDGQKRNWRNRFHHVSSWNEVGTTLNPLFVRPENSVFDKFFGLMQFFRFKNVVQMFGWFVVPRPMSVF